MYLYTRTTRIVWTDRHRRRRPRASLPRTPRRRSRRTATAVWTNESRRGRLSVPAGCVGARHRLVAVEGFAQAAEQSTGGGRRLGDLVAGGVERDLVHEECEHQGLA